MNRLLTLTREHLAELTPHDLATVAGGDLSGDCGIPTIARCLTGYYPSLNAPCETLLRPLETIIGPTG